MLKAEIPPQDLLLNMADLAVILPEFSLRTKARYYISISEQLPTHRHTLAQPITAAPKGKQLMMGPEAGRLISGQNPAVGTQILNREF